MCLIYNLGYRIESKFNFNKNLQKSSGAFFSTWLERIRVEIEWYGEFGSLIGREDPKFIKKEGPQLGNLIYIILKKEIYI